MTTDKWTHSNHKYGYILLLYSQVRGQTTLSSVWQTSLRSHLACGNTTCAVNGQVLWAPVWQFTWYVIKQLHGSHRTDCFAFYISQDSPPTVDIS